LRVLYVDPGLVSDSNHHANNCRAISAALRARGHTVEIVAHRLIGPGLREELGARPHFRLLPYQRIPSDQVNNWHGVFLSGARIYAEDVLRLGPFDSEMSLYANSIQPAQLMGLCGVLRAIAPDQRPQVFAEFGTEPGLDYIDKPSGGHFVARDPCVDPRATTYRYAGVQIRQAALGQLHLSTFDRSSSELYARLLGLPVRTLPVPRFTNANVHRRGATRPLTIGILGHQRRDKRYNLVPDIVTLLLRLRADIRFLVHCADPDLVPIEQQQMRALAAAQPRVTLDERAAGADDWAALLAQCDLILCPYDPAVFRAGYSAITCEALANAIPLVVPACTTLSRMLNEFGNPGIAFKENATAEQTVASIVLAVHDAVEQFDKLADRAMEAAAKWRTTMGADAMVEALLAPAWWKGF
jgi:hypothetical protein